LRTYFYRFFSTAPWSHPSPESKKLLEVDKEGFSLQYFFFSFILICPLSSLPVQLEERAISPAIPTFYTHNPLKVHKV
jgi:hypothetical protein